MGLTLPTAARRVGAFVVATLALGCTVDPSGSEISAPDVNAIYVFFPSGNRVSDGLVRGRGLPGAMPREASHALIESYPTGHSRVVEIGADGGFDFEIIAISGDVLEIRGATSARADELGAAAYVRVPASIEPFVPHVCCPETNTCQSIYDREAGVACPVAAPGLVICQVDVDCAVFEREYLPLRPEQVTLTRPNANGVVDVEGRVVPNVLVTLANVGKSAIGSGLTEEEAQRRGLADPGVRLTRISDDRGQFRFAEVPAVADDEIIIQLFDLVGFRSPPYAVRVPDPMLAGVDVLGVFPWEPLTNGQRGKVAVRLSPYGIDGRGICPDGLDNRDGLELCVGGGLDHQMVTFNSAQLDLISDPARALDPVATATDAVTPHNRGVTGNVRSEPLDIFVVVDMSDDALRIDPDQLAVSAVSRYVRYLRQRDRVGLIRTGGPPRLITGLTSDRNAVISAVDALARDVRSGENSILAGVQLAADELAKRSGRTAGRVVVISFGPPVGTVEAARAELDDVLDVVEENNEIAFDGYRVDVVGIQLPASGALVQSVQVLEDLATFAQGFYLPVATLNELEQALADLRGEQVGSFTLLYDMRIPINAGKQGQVLLDLRVQIPGSGAQNGSYQGPLRIANAPNP